MAIFFNAINFVILILPTYLVGTPFDILPRIPTVINAIHADVLYNSIYGFFKKRNQLKLWTTICVVEFFLVNPLLTGITFTFLFPPAFVLTFINYSKGYYHSQMLKVYFDF